MAEMMQDETKPTVDHYMQKTTSKETGESIYPVTIECKNLVVTAKKTQILKGIDATFATGTLTALMGSSGAGITLIHLINLNIHFR